MTTNIIDLFSSRMRSYGDRKERRLSKFAELLSAEAERLGPIHASAEEFASRFGDGEFSKSFAVEVAEFLDVPKDKMEELFLLLKALDERR